MEGVNVNRVIWYPGGHAGISQMNLPRVHKVVRKNRRASFVKLNASTDAVHGECWRDVDQSTGAGWSQQILKHNSALPLDAVSETSDKSPIGCSYLLHWSPLTPRCRHEAPQRSRKGSNMCLRAQAAVEVHVRTNKLGGFSYTF